MRTPVARMTLPVLAGQRDGTAFLLTSLSGCKRLRGSQVDRLWGSSLTSIFVVTYTSLHPTMWVGVGRQPGPTREGFCA